MTSGMKWSAQGLGLAVFSTFRITCVGFISKVTYDNVKIKIKISPPNMAK